MRHLSFALALLLIAGSANAASATYRVTLAKGTSTVLTQNLAVDLDTPAEVSHVVPFHMTGGCSTRGGGKPDRLDGDGESKQTVTVKPIVIGRGRVTTVVTLANSELAAAVPTAVGACTAATPGMLTWDASAKFDLEPGAANTFSVGDYTVVLTLLSVDTSRAVPRTAI